MISEASEMWCPDPGPVDLPGDAVHVWSIGLGLDEDVLNGLRTSLSSDEVERADRFHFPRDSRRYAASRGALRWLLYRYTGVPASEIVFTYGAQGKPTLAESCRSAAESHADIQFNVSHAADRALIALVSDSDIGVDVEAARHGIDPAAIAHGYFAPAESKQLLALEPDLQRAAFFRCWTRKEAFIKAVGQGVSFGLHRFEVTLRPDDPPRLVQIDGDGRAASEWTLRDLPTGPGFSAAVAYRGDPRRLSGFRFDATKMAR